MPDLNSLPRSLPSISQASARANNASTQNFTEVLSYTQRLPRLGQLSGLENRFASNPTQHQHRLPPIYSTQFHRAPTENPSNPSPSAIQTGFQMSTTPSAASLRDDMVGAPYTRPPQGIATPRPLPPPRPARPLDQQLIPAQVIRPPPPTPLRATAWTSISPPLPARFPRHTEVSVTRLPAEFRDRYEWNLAHAYAALVNFNSFKNDPQKRISNLRKFERNMDEMTEKMDADFTNQELTLSRSTAQFELNTIRAKLEQAWTSCNLLDTDAARHTSKPLGDDKEVRSAFADNSSSSRSTTLTSLPHTRPQLLNGTEWF